MKISIVVPAYNEQKLIVSTLQAIQTALAPFHQRSWETEIIVCDNNSTDTTAELARGAGARVVFEPVNQISRARNCGAAVATGDWLLFVDADSKPNVALMNEVAQVMGDDRYLAGGCVVKMDEMSLLITFMAGLWNRLSRWQKWFAGSFIFCRTDAFRAIGGFSTEFFAAEEIDFSKRLKQHARVVGKSMIVLHRHPLMTSARKMKLYTPREHLRLFFNAIFRQNRFLRSREACHFWYDGRR